MNNTHTPTAGPMVDRMRDMHAERQRRDEIARAYSLREDMRDAFTLAACAVFAFCFVASLPCAAFGLTIAAAYLFCAGIGAGCALGILGHVVPFAVYTIQTARL